MKLYHNYPQHPDSHPERPWWRRNGMTYRRSDGVVLYWGPLYVNLVHVKDPDPRGLMTPEEAEDIPLLGNKRAMERIDREHPLPDPPPLIGQAWVDPRDEKEATGAASVVAVGQYLVALTFVIDGLAMVHRLAGTPLHHQLFRHTAGGPPEFDKDWPEVDWPPVDHVLVAGPLSPWAPPDDGRAQ